MTKNFCDVCSRELTVANKPQNQITFATAGRLAVKTEAGLFVEILTGFNSTLNAGDFCKYCIIDAVNTLDNRPQPVAATSAEVKQLRNRLMAALAESEDTHDTVIELRQRIGKILEEL